MSKSQIKGCSAQPSPILIVRDVLSSLIPVKCDGARPQCLGCASKKRECFYRGEEGQSEKSILNARIEEGQLREAALNSLIESLQQRVQELQASQRQADCGESTQRDEPSAQPNVIQQRSSSRLLVLPSAQLTKRAVEEFFSCSGKLFHVFSEAQVSRITDSVFGGGDRESEDGKADIASLMAVAAVGSQYAHATMENEIQEEFYSIAKTHSDFVITRRPLEGVKVCTLLCMYNVFAKATVSLAYADAGLGMCDRYGLHCQRCQLAGIEDSVWVDYRKTWRTLVFLSTWLSATLGYRTGNDQAFRRIIALSELHIENQAEVSEAVQTEMAKIAVLKARILHMDLAFQYLTPGSLNSMTRDLQDWHDKLPLQMRLQNLEANLSLELRRSIYHVHLLYLGAHMLLFRRIVAENIRRDPNLSRSKELHSEQCPAALIAARMSASIFKLLLDENGIFRRCWLVIFQSYISCIVIMYTVVTRLVAHEVQSYQEEMDNARLCIDTLAYCGASDPVASRFLDNAQGIYDSVLEHIDKYTEALQIPNDQPTAGGHFSDGGNTTTTGDNNLDNIPASYEPSAKELICELLEMLCRPFRHPSQWDGTKESLAATHQDSSQYEHPVLMERIEWDFEDSSPFRSTSAEVLGIGGVDIAVPDPGEASTHNTYLEPEPLP
ncbi:hypothetical protein F5Y08DRAFT_335715 [Xylaria arbuscula]|nr:hypothetical protein F5Y08DRAFT_335715 [Xylaria arbuscula]